MFDPTAFENMRIVMEGCFYDKDLSGEIRITDRNDCINTAKITRTYDLSFQLSSPKPIITCRFSIHADLQNLTAELLPSTQSNKLAGSFVTVDFLFEHSLEKSILNEVEMILTQIWGEERTIRITYCYEPLELSEKKGIFKAEIRFNRIITEEQIDDLMAMSDYMLLTLRGLEEVL